jgi:HSP20 family protein
MSTTRVQPFGTVWPEMNRLQDEMEQRLCRAVMNDPRRSAQSVYPALNLWEDDNNLYLEAELPELDLTDLEISVNGDNVLAVALPKGEEAKAGRTEVKCC